MDVVIGYCLEVVDLLLFSQSVELQSVVVVRKSSDEQDGGRSFISISRKRTAISDSVPPFSETSVFTEINMKYPNKMILQIQFLNVCTFDYTAVAGSGKVGPVNRFNHTSWVAVVTLTDRPKSVRNRCVIELFGCF